MDSRSSCQIYRSSQSVRRSWQWVHKSPCGSSNLEDHRILVHWCNYNISIAEATPKTVMKLMGIPGLTLYHLKSHLQVRASLHQYLQTILNFAFKKLQTKNSFFLLKLVWCNYWYFLFVIRSIDWARICMDKATTWHTKWVRYQSLSFSDLLMSHRALIDG